MLGLSIQYSYKAININVMKKKKNKITPFTATRMYLEILILSEKRNTIGYHLYVECKIWHKYAADTTEAT